MQQLGQMNLKKRIGKMVWVLGFGENIFISSITITVY